MWVYLSCWWAYAHEARQVLGWACAVFFVGEGGFREVEHLHIVNFDYDDDYDDYDDDDDDDDYDDD